MSPGSTRPVVVFPPNENWPNGSASPDLIITGVCGEIGQEPVDEFAAPTYLSKEVGTRYLVTHGIIGDFALVWQPVPAGMPGRSLLAYLCAITMVVAGAGLLFRQTARLATTVLFVYFLLWLVPLSRWESPARSPAGWCACAATQQCFLPAPP